jgi:hypothetical protein
MPQTTTTQITKKQAPLARKPTSVKPHRDLTPTQEEVADLASDLLINGGSQQDLYLLLTALFRHQYRKFSFAKEATEATVAARAEQWLHRSSQQIIKHWPEPVEDPAKEPTPTTVKEIARTNVRRELQMQYEEFVTRTYGLEPIWMLNEILEYCTSGAYDLAKSFAVVMDADDTYVRVPWSQADKVRAFVELIAEKESN